MNKTLAFAITNDCKGESSFYRKFAGVEFAEYRSLKVQNLQNIAV